jgi:hypothetical protein
VEYDPARHDAVNYRLQPANENIEFRRLPGWSHNEGGTLTVFPLVGAEATKGKMVMSECDGVADARGVLTET